MTTERGKKVCSCGTDVWEGTRPRYLEHVVCPNCGADHSTPPPLRWRIRYGLRILRKTRRKYGVRAALSLGFDAFRLPRERDDVEQKQTEDPVSEIDQLAGDGHDPVDYSQPAGDG